VTGRCTRHDHGLTGRVRSVQRSSQTRGCKGFALVRLVTRGTGASGRAPRIVARGVKLIEHAARPVTHDRTHPVVKRAYWTPNRRWHCRVRSLSRARSIDASQARGAVRSARPVG
jgi:hypothetical protein